MRYEIRITRDPVSAVWIATTRVGPDSTLLYWHEVVGQGSTREEALEQLQRNVAIHHERQPLRDYSEVVEVDW